MRTFRVARDSSGLLSTIGIIIVYVFRVCLSNREMFGGAGAGAGAGVGEPPRARRLVPWVEK